MPLDYLQAKKSWAFQYRRMSHISISLTFNLQFPPYLLDSQYIRTANSVPSLACHIKSLLIKVLTIRQRGQITGGYLCSIFYWLGGPHCQQKVSDAPPNPILTPVFLKTFLVSSITGQFRLPAKQIPIWSLGGRMFIKECLWDQHLWNRD